MSALGCPSRIPPAFPRFLSSTEPPQLFLSLHFWKSDLFKLFFFTIAPHVLRSKVLKFPADGKEQEKNAEKGENTNWYRGNQGRNILVSLLYLAAEVCGQIYNECIPAGLQDRVKLTPRSSRQVEGWTGTGPGRREPACLNKAQSTDCSTVVVGPAQPRLPGAAPVALSRCWAGFVSFLGSQFPQVWASHQLGDSLKLLCPSQLSPGHPKPRVPHTPGDTERGKCPAELPHCQGSPSLSCVHPALSLAGHCCAAQGWDTPPQTFSEVNRPEKGRLY